MSKKISKKTKEDLLPYFNENIKSSGIILPKINEGHVFHQYTIKITKECKKTRDEVVGLLRNNEISAQVYYPLPIHKQELYKEDYKNQSYPISEKVSNEVLSLPVHPVLTEEDLNKIVNVLNSIK